MKKIIFVNFLILYLLSSLIITLSSIIVDIYKSNKTTFYNDTRSELPNYNKINWAKKHFEEFNSLKTSYYDYIIWRRNDFKGDTVTIKNGYRLNNNQENFKLNKDIWVFGGSTTWGTGSNNENTIPALIEKISGISTLNLGETGYETTQQLNLLIRELVKHKPKMVIFYNGVNVLGKCRKNIHYFSSGQENIINSKVNVSHTENLIDAPKWITQKIIQKLKNQNKNKNFDCDTNEVKAKNITKIFINNWKTVKLITEQINIKFIPILQPTAYSSESNLNYLNLDQEQKTQYQKMYEMIKRELENSKFEYLNLENSLDKKENFFIGFCHLSPNGNLEIAKKIVNSKLFNN